MAEKRMRGCLVAAAIVLLAVLLVLGGAVWGGVTVIRAWRRPAGVVGFTRLLRDWQNVRTAWQGIVEQVDKEPKLVVLQSSLTVFVSHTSEKRLFWERLNLGDNVVELRAEDNRVQYVVPLGRFSDRDVTYDAERRVLTITVPPPELDTGMIAVQSDPTKLHLRTKTGWARFRSETVALEDDVRQGLREVVRRYGESEHLRDSARLNAEAVLRQRLFAPLAAALAEHEVELRLRFRE